MLLVSESSIREHFSNELLLIEVFLCWENHCFSDEGALVLFFFSDGVNTFDLEPTNSAPTKTRLMLSPSFLAITDRSLTPSLSSNTWCFPLCNALVIALQTLQYISYFRVNELLRISRLTWNFDAVSDPAVRLLNSDPFKWINHVLCAQTVNKPTL